LSVVASGASSSAWAWACVSQLPVRVPADLTPLTLPMPLASCASTRWLSAASRARALSSAGQVVRFLLPACDAAQLQVTHQPGDPVMSDLVALAVELTPDLFDAIDAEVCAVHASDLDLQPLVAELPSTLLASEHGVVRGRGDLQRLADRLDSPALAVSAYELHDFLGSRGSSSAAKKAEAAFRISLARRSSRTSRSSSAIRRCSSVSYPVACHGRCRLV
jgi:hypothetical protein